MPGIEESIVNDSSGDTNQPETIPLHLPSAITPYEWLTGCISGVVDKER